MARKAKLKKKAKGRKGRKMSSRKARMIGPRGVVSSGSVAVGATPLDPMGDLMEDGSGGRKLPRRSASPVKGPSTKCPM